MEFSNKPVGNVEIVPSMEAVEFVVDDGVYRAEYDSSRDQPSLAIVAAIAAADQRDPYELTPLHSAIDTGALDELFATTATEGQRNGCLSFPYEGFEVTVSSEGVIEAKPTENA
ncbi:HalOD1 output domain-containing protein (plasmid) [Natrialbaceae archaeon A-CW3]